MKYFALLFLLTVATVPRDALPRERESRTLLDVNQNGKCGYIDRNGTIVIKPQFDKCWGFSEGMSSVVVGDRLGVIDETGSFILQPQLEWYPTYFQEGLATVTIRERNKRGLIERELRGYLNREGQLLWLPPAIREVSNFHEGMAVAGNGSLKGYLDKNLKFAIEPKFKQAGSFGNGLAPVCEVGGSCYYINKSGTKVIGRDGSEFVNGFASFEENEKYGFINVKGETVIAPQFERVGFFHGGLAKVEINGKWGYLDEAGKILIAARYDEADDFLADGIAAVQMNGKWGFIDSNGAMLIAPQFDSASWCGDGVGKIAIRGKAGYINRFGNYVWSPSK